MINSFPLRYQPVSIYQYQGSLAVAQNLKLSSVCMSWSSGFSPNGIDCSKLTM